MVLSLVFVRLNNFGWSPVYDCKAYLETNTVKNCSYFSFGGYFLVSGTLGVSAYLSLIGRRRAWALINFFGL